MTSRSGFMGCKHVRPLLEVMYIHTIYSLYNYSSLCPCMYVLPSSRRLQSESCL